jgi:ketosteroid isomerase-like protein
MTPISPTYACILALNSLLFRANGRAYIPSGRRRCRVGPRLEHCFASSGYSPIMSQDEIDRMRRGYEAFNEGDLEPLLGLLDPDVQWRGIMGETYHGVAGVRGFFEQLPWNPPACIEPEEFIEAGDCYLVPVRVSLKGRASGIDAGGHVCQAILFRDGKIVEYREHGTKEDALKALGLRA